MGFIEKAKQNRCDFLEPYRVQVEDLRSRISDLNRQEKTFERGKETRKLKKEIKTIITHLLKIEPTHIREYWILDIIDDWKAEGEKVSLPSTRGVRQPVKGRDARLKILFFEIRRYNERMKATFGPRRKRKRSLEYAIEKTGEGWNKRHPENPIKLSYLRKEFFKKQESELPWPYWLRDISEERGGTYKIQGRGIIEFEVKK
jgi:hypothetical protein